jgi:hypothetical protein
MKLTKDQQDLLANHIAKKPIDYIELYNELYDHYASAYENSEETFEETLEKLDEHFHYQRVKRINSNLLKKTRQSVNEIYWTEFKNFWRWPQILSTVAVLIVSIIVIEFLQIKTAISLFVFPTLLFNVGLLIYGPILKYFNKIAGKKFESAHFRTTQHYLNLPTSIFNLSVFLPIMAVDSATSKLVFFERFPFIVLIFILLFTASSLIGFKVFKTKIKVQYL